MRRELDFMEFCSKCGSLLVTKKIKTGNQRLLVLACSKCGSKTESAPNRLNGKTINHNPKQVVVVIDEEKEFNTLPTVKFTCVKCGNQDSYAWQVQTHGSDKSSTQFLRCTTCGYTFRETS